MKNSRNPLYAYKRLINKIEGRKVFNTSNFFIDGFVYLTLLPIILLVILLSLFVYCLRFIIPLAVIIAIYYFIVREEGESLRDVLRFGQSEQQLNHD